MHPRLPTVLLLLVTTAIAAVGGKRIYDLERAEVEHITEARSLRAMTQGPHASRVSARMTSLELRAGDRALFELCADDGLKEASWRDAFEIAVIALDQKKLLLRVPLDAAHLSHVKRTTRGGCLLLGSGTLDATGLHSVEAVWMKGAPPAQVLDVPLRLRVLSKPVLTAADRMLLLGLAIMVLAVLVISGWKHASTANRTRAQPQRVAVVGALLLLLFAAQLPLFGATLTFVKGLLLLGLQLGVAWMFTRRDGVHPREHLALVRPPEPLIALAMALAAWPLLVYGAKLALRVVPATGEAPIETFISWPSGMFAAALLGVLLPVGEELFFRGYVYGALLPLGRASAFSVSVIAFSALHAQQSWGQWGALLSVTFAGLVFTALRALTGSTVIPVLTHVAYNLALSWSSLAH
jgi:membrane protease YdiL (CAAX protease family)